MELIFQVAVGSFVGLILKDLYYYVLGGNKHPNDTFQEILEELKKINKAP